MPEYTIELIAVGCGDLFILFRTTLRRIMTIDPKTAERVVNLLENLTVEHTGWKRFFVRYRISDYPLRSDAKHLLDFLRRIEMNEVAIKASREAGAKYANVRPRC